MIRSRFLHHARRLSTSPSTNSNSRLRLSSLAFITTTGVLVSSYFLWPSKYRGSPTFNHRPLSPSYFIPVTISENSQVGPDLAVLTLSVPPDSRSSDESDTLLDPIWSIFIKDDDIQVERPYTPLFGIDEGVIKLWVKRYSRGEVGRWLHSKQAGDTIEIRGPLKTFPFREGEWDEVVMLLFRHLLQGKVAPSTRVTLLHASPSPAELPPLSLLQPLIDCALTHPEHFQLNLFVDGAFQNASARKFGRIDKSSIAHTLGIPDGAWSWSSRISNLWTRGQPKAGDTDIRKKNVLVLVCGPESMVATIAGPYGRNHSQGKVGGVLAELGFKAGQVWKL
ncbi:hypothetical protein F5888DRAFT_1791692 [Russula emetica]|nr:hypothetical protein F5888DRAFT_1791692 [Russula emetica]